MMFVTHFFCYTSEAPGVHGRTSIVIIDEFTLYCYPFPFQPTKLLPYCLKILGIRSDLVPKGDTLDTMTLSIILAHKQVAGSRISTSTGLRLGRKKDTASSVCIGSRPGAPAFTAQQFG